MFADEWVAKLSDRHDVIVAFAFKLEKEAELVEQAIVKTLDLGYRTKDIGSSGMRIVGTGEMGDAIGRSLGG